MAAAPPGSASPRIIDAYGNGGFRIGGEAFQGSILILPDGTVRGWSADVSALSAASFDAVIAVSPPPEILLLGCGARAAFVPVPVRQRLREAGIVIDAMGTGAACRTYNVLISEERRVAAALIAVD
ncbi:MAG TPA: Mth938-like domain-containing protein [Alphaproteobacteria bacterium]|nr:Mth938-like domain-containing protein [Alphaproteobacteria bacterium]